MRGDSFLRDPVHLRGTDLNLNALSLWTDHRRVQRLVHVRLRHRDEVFEAARYRLPRRVNNSKRLVARAHRRDDHAKTKDIVHILKGEFILLHLLPD